MIPLGAALLLLAMAAPSEQEAPASDEGKQLEATRLVTEERFAEALVVLDRVKDPVARQAGLTSLYLAAEDPVGALREAQRGLAEDPHHLDLLFWACQASLWLSATSLAERYSHDLTEAIELEATLDGETRSQWREVARGFAAENARLLRAGEVRDAAVQRARGVAGIGLLATLAALLLLALAPLSARSEGSISAGREAPFRTPDR
jgi:hypothetical protein